MLTSVWRGRLIYACGAVACGAFLVGVVLGGPWNVINGVLVASTLALTALTTQGKAHT
jgi:hypothetical protein